MFLNLRNWMPWNFHVLTYIRVMKIRVRRNEDYGLIKHDKTHLHLHVTILPIYRDFKFEVSTPRIYSLILHFYVDFILKLRCHCFGF